MKRHHKKIAAALVIAGGLYVASRAHNPHVSAPVVCDPSLWTHTYAGDPRKFTAPEDRLKVIEPCKRVTGTIYSVKPEADGDLHIRLTLDAGEEGLLNAKNISGQLGTLVLEPVCATTVTQNDTIQEHACDNYHSPIKVPPVGTHVTVIGPYVTDQEHGWNEIHPVNSITVQ